MATYTEMVQMVRDWSNRDQDVLSSANIKTFINFAADNVYRDLRIAPLEFVYEYPRQNIAATDTETHNTLAIPSDAIEFIQLRKKDTNSDTGYVVYEAKSDIRSFLSEDYYRGDYYAYTRERNNLIVHPNIEDGNEFELFYYRRLPEIDARYIADSDSAAAFIDTSVTAADTAADPDLAALGFAYNGQTAYGGLIPNWLRDQNEKLILFGALTEAFTYLDEPQQAAKYAQRFDQELNNLNDEENNRKYKGGNIQLRYRSSLI